MIKNERSLMVLLMFLTSHKNKVSQWNISTSMLIQSKEFV